MHFFAILSIVLVSFFASTAQARPQPRRAAPRPVEEPASRLRLAAPAGKSVVDTTYILGGPDRWDGSFETPGGQPDWQGWTHEDKTFTPSDNHWHVSTYWAEYIAGHGVGNHALYCGDETIPACAPPDTIGGVGPDLLDDVDWRSSVPDNTQPVTVRLTGLMNFDLPDEGWDFLELILIRGLQWDIIESWTGVTDTTVTLDFTTVVSPGEFVGPGNDEVRIVWRVWTSTDGWDDVDCISPSHGACQIDDLAVYFDDELITFDDFEPGNPVNWNPSETPGVGDFSNLRNDLGEIDPCGGNSTWQVNFVDDGVVVPGTGGTPCYIWCYDPGGWQVNNTGGLLAGDTSSDWFLNNQILSPPMAWPTGHDAAELAFDVYRHETLTGNAAGVFYLWSVRSTDSTDPADLELATWKSRNRAYSGGPDFHRQVEWVTDLMVPDRKWVQISLEVHELGWQWGFNGPNGTPAPYFDNVAFKTWAPDGPRILVRDDNVLGDAFPEVGTPDPANLANNWCRVDMKGLDFNDVRGDSLAARITSLRPGSTMLQPPAFHWVMQCNPTFDSVRPAVPDGQGILRGMTSGSNISQDIWAFDLPDSGFFFPGDRLRYYLIATDDLDGNQGISVWPPDTTGILDYSTTSPFPLISEIRGLPTLTQPEAGVFAHPAILLFADSHYDPAAWGPWFTTLEDLGFEQGVDFDFLCTPTITDIASLGDLGQYETLLCSAGPQGYFTSYEGEDEALLISDWLDLGGRKALLAGENMISGTGTNDLISKLGTQYHYSDVSAFNGGIRDLQISPLPGNGLVPDDIQWMISDGCPGQRNPDAIGAAASGVVGATLDPQGSTGGAYASLVSVDDLVLGNRTVVMPFDLYRVDGMVVTSVGGDKSWTPAAYLVSYLLTWLGEDFVSDAGQVPGAGLVTVAAHPNPFNPTTTIAFELPRAAEVSLDIYDLQGRLVRRLLDESPYVSGAHQQVWDGRDGEGRGASSGVYFYRFTAIDQKLVGKLTLLK